MALDESERTKRLLSMLEPLHDRTRATARRLCRSHADGDDLFHEAVLRALDRLDELREPEKFRAWFFAILLSVHRARHRRRFWRRLLPLDELREEPTVEAAADSLDGARRMARALATLAPAEREAIVLFELEGFTIEELTQLQASSIPAVKSRLVRARARLRRHYERSEKIHRTVVEESGHEHG
jgi:RNA polymerase sigma-70 factor (ECF subfamily)